MAQLVSANVYGALKRLLFTMDPERAHHLALAALRSPHRSPLARRAFAAPLPSPRLASTCFGLGFSGPLGMAAGFDKEAGAYNALLALGFSHVELGTITPVAQPGNPKPRVWRFPEHEALVNAMGFPGPGVDAVKERLRKIPPIGLIGGNIGPNKDTEVTEVPARLAELAADLAPRVDYLAVNVSSPNTPGLRALQEPGTVAVIVEEVANAAADAGHKRPVLLKVHPDAPDARIVKVAAAAVDAGAAGIIGVNTTRERPAGTEEAKVGGLSGSPLRERALHVVSKLYEGLGRDTPIIGVGGVQDAVDAIRFVQAGASLVQTYTGFIYRGPRQPRNINSELVNILDELGFDKLEEAVGTG